MDGEADLENRDPNNLNDHLGVSYEEVIGEPDAIHSLDCVWKLSYKCFNLWLKLCYVIVTTLYGIWIACYWGCYFSILAFYHIWIITPCIKAYEINVKCVGKVYSVVIHSCCDPCCEACGKIFGAFKK